MIYKFKIVTDDTLNFKRVIEIDPDASFFVFRNAILDSVGYDKNEFNTFFVCDEDWKRESEVVIEDFGSASDKDIWIMDSTLLSELIDEEGTKVEFIFDQLSERSFFIELIEIITGKTLSAPICTVKEGKPPVQNIDPLDLIEPQATSHSKDEIDFDFYGDSEYNDDEISSGYDDMEIN